MSRDRSIATRLREAGVVLRIGFPPMAAPFMRRTVIGITFGNRIWIHPQVLERAPDSVEPILRHELVHVMQYRRDGVVRFLARYLSEYLRGRLAGQSHFEAYRGVSYEREAFGEEKEGSEED